ncbi:SpoIIE family protein phosphatase [Crocinitomix catalasitica]|nr:SpoIIE family protein phosphatase [Crocinitomix catalasitica]
MTHRFDLQKGDACYVFSNGFIDQFGGEKGKKSKARPLRELLVKLQDASLSERKEMIDKTFEEWLGELEQIDDVCVIGVRV